MQLKSVATIHLIHLVLSAAIFGFFYAYACSVMIGLDFADSQTAIRAMQAINATVRNPWFAPAFFGPLASGIITVLLYFRTGASNIATMLLIATGIYFLGAFLPTMLFSVPLNNELALITGTDISKNSSAIWQAYSQNWNFWNLLRTFASALSLTVSAIALTQHRPQAGNKQEPHRDIKTSEGQRV